MADYNKVVTPGNVNNSEVNIVVEIPTGSSHKIEWRRHEGYFALDRVEPEIFAKPMNYGFIPQTLDEDGDELDAVVITDEPLPTGVVVTAKVIGVINFVDDGEVDDKIIAVPADDRNTGDAITSLEDVSPQLLKQLEFHFSHYKDLKKPGSTTVSGINGHDEAIDIVLRAIDRWSTDA